MEPDTPKRRLQHQRREEQAAEEQQSAQGRAALQFDSVEELLRYDAAQTAPPPAIAERLQGSLRAEPAPKRSWWQRLFKKAAR
ncbi:MAG TPA: hypothetical protein VMV72_05300 [Verrucomicrobiae bacterium]|nr:hypothetical protein [Verrucomicrobiae bacterium]